MQVVGEDQRRPPKGRTKTETAFKRLNNCVLVVHLTTFLIVATICSIAAGKTMTTAFWAVGRELVLDTTIDAKTTNCSMAISEGAGGWDAYAQVISRADFEYRLAWFTGSVKISLVLCGITLLIGAFNKALMELNVFEIKLKAMVVRKEIITTIELILIVCCYVFIADVEGDADILQRYLRHCGVVNQQSLPFQPPFVAIYIGLSWTLFCHCLSFVALLYATCVKPPPYDTTRDLFQNKLSPEVKLHAMSMEQTQPYPENAIFQSAVDFAAMDIPQDGTELGPVDAYQHATVGLVTPPLTPAGGGAAAMDPNAAQY